MRNKQQNSESVFLGRARSGWRRAIKWGGMAAAALAFAGFCQSAAAAQGALPLAAVLTPDEYDIPTFDKTHTFFFQTGAYDYVGTQLDAAGRTQPFAALPGSSAQIFEGISRIGQIRPGFEVKGIGRVNWYWEVLLPEVLKQFNGPISGAIGQSASGIGDPLVAAGLLHQWTGFRLFGYDSRFTASVSELLSVPAGGSQVTAHQFVETPFATADITVGKLGFQTAFGAQISSKARTGACPGGCDTGNNYFVTGSLHYQATPWLMPYLYNVYEVGMPDTGAPGGVYEPGHIADLLGAGARVNFTPATFVDAYYLTNLSFVGHNSLKNKALITRFVHLW